MAAPASRCPECGAALPGARDGCQALFDAACARSLVDPAHAAVHRLVVDAYCMQHLDPYGASAKSYAAHLAGLCVGVEHDGDPRLHAAVQRWLNGSVPIARPEPPPGRGAVTLADVVGAGDLAPDALSDPDAGGGHATRVRRWADAVWQAYAAQHALARHWIALASQPGFRRR